MHALAELMGTYKCTAMPGSLMGSNSCYGSCRFCSCRQFAWCLSAWVYCPATVLLWRTLWHYRGWMCVFVELFLLFTVCLCASCEKPANLYHIESLFWVSFHSPNCINLPNAWMYAAKGNVNCRSSSKVLRVRALHFFLACWVRVHLSWA